MKNTLPVTATKLASISIISSQCDLLCVLVGTMPATARRRDHQTGRPLASWETPAALSPDQFDWPPEARLTGSTVSAHPTFLPAPVIIYILIGLCL